ncbi:MAG: hypothetical protein ABZF75_00125 [Columbia Basin potato purple top phytoplasma]
MLNSAEEMRNDLEKRNRKIETDYRNEILKPLNSLYEITPTEG